MEEKLKEKIAFVRHIKGIRVKCNKTDCVFKFSVYKFKGKYPPPPVPPHERQRMLDEQQQSVQEGRINPPGIPPPGFPPLLVLSPGHFSLEYLLFQDFYNLVYHLLVHHHFRHHLVHHLVHPRPRNKAVLLSSFQLICSRS